MVGMSKAMSIRKSPERSGSASIRSRAARVFSRMASSRALNRRGVKARWAIARMRVWSGGMRADSPGRR
jgi:hypothetical protein